MKATNNALILMWKGNEMSEHIIVEIADILFKHRICIPEMLTMKYKDEAGVTDSLLKDSIESPKISVENDALEAIKSAIIYIGKQFESSLSTTEKLVGNIAIFAIELSNAVSLAKQDTMFTRTIVENELLTAIEILAKVETIPATLSNVAKNYHFSKNILKVIKKVYNSQLQ